MPITETKVYYKVFTANMQTELSKIADELKAEGFSTKRGLGGSVILQLTGGEVHYIPGDGEIVRVITEEREEAI